MVKKKAVKKRTAGKKTTKKKVKAGKKRSEEPSWDEIGESIGKKIEKASKEGKFDCRSWDFRHKVHCHGTGGCFYFLGFVSALVYYVTTAPTFWDAFLGFFKALVWPAFLVFGLLQFIGA